MPTQTQSKKEKFECKVLTENDPLLKDFDVYDPEKRGSKFLDDPSYKYIHIMISKFNLVSVSMRNAFGKPVLDIRKWMNFAQRGWIPTSKGITLSPGYVLPVLRNAEKMFLENLDFYKIDEEKINGGAPK